MSDLPADFKCPYCGAKVASFTKHLVDCPNFNAKIGKKPSPSLLKEYAKWERKWGPEGAREKLKFSTPAEPLPLEEQPEILKKAYAKIEDFHKKYAALDGDAFEIYPLLEKANLEIEANTFKAHWMPFVQYLISIRREVEKRYKQLTGKELG